jgi:hypothetical protein
MKPKSLGKFTMFSLHPLKKHGTIEGSLRGVCTLLHIDEAPSFEGINSQPVLFARASL